HLEAGRWAVLGRRPRQRRRGEKRGDPQRRRDVPGVAGAGPPAQRTGPDRRRRPAAGRDLHRRGVRDAGSVDARRGGGRAPVAAGQRADGGRHHTRRGAPRAAPRADQGGARSGRPAGSRRELKCIQKAGGCVPGAEAPEIPAMPIDGFSPLRIQSFREPSPPPTPPAAPANAPSLGARDRLARRDSAFEGTARLPARVTPDLRPMGPGPSIPPLSPEEQQALGSALPPTGGPQMPWSRNDGYPQPTALAGTMMARAREQGLLSTSQVDRSASVANRAVPDAQLRQLSAGDVGAMAREAGVPVERLDPGQLQQASRLINGATTPQEQRDRIALSLNNLSVAAGGRMPELSRQDMQAMLWAEAKVPGHAVEGLSDSALRGVFSQVT